jgi:hypothetical protein
MMNLARISLLAPLPLKGIFACEELFVTPQTVLHSLLPPVIHFNDTASLGFIVTEGDFLTPAESSNFTETPTYDQVMTFYTDLAAYSEHVKLKTLLTFPSGEEIILVTVSGEKAFNASDMTKPIVYMTAGIHAGESMGVSAGKIILHLLLALGISTWSHSIFSLLLQVCCLSAT